MSYSVPAKLIGRRVRVVLRAGEVIIFDGRRELVRHERSTDRGSATLVLEHYLEVLAHKPGALPGATALVQARACGSFTATHEAFWAAARRQHGDAAGTRELVEVLLLHRHLAAAQVSAGIEAALSVGAARADVVAVEARRTADTSDRKPVDLADLDSGSWPSGVVSLTERRLADPAAVIAGLPADTRPAPRVDPYDQLLTRRTATTAATTAASAEGQVS